MQENEVEQVEKVVDSCVKFQGEYSIVRESLRIYVTLNKFEQALNAFKILLEKHADQICVQECKTLIYTCKADGNFRRGIEIFKMLKARFDQSAEAKAMELLTNTNSTSVELVNSKNASTPLPVLVSTCLTTLFRCLSSARPTSSALSNVVLLLSKSLECSYQLSAFDHSCVLRSLSMEINPSFAKASEILDKEFNMQSQQSLRVSPELIKQLIDLQSVATLPSQQQFEAESELESHSEQTTIV